MITTEIIKELNSMEIDDSNEDEMIERLDMLMCELSRNDDAHSACETMIALLEKHTDVDFGGPGAIVHTIEDYTGQYEELLFESLKRRQSNTTVMLLQRIINAEKDPVEVKRLLKIYKDCAKHPLAGKQLKYSVREYLKYRKSIQQKK